MIPITALTTLAHLYSLQVSPNPFYSTLILSNTGVSFLWHLVEEQNTPLAILDYGIAMVWGFTDLSYGYHSGYFREAFALNFFVFFMDMMSAYTDRDSYVMWHSAWHLVSALKTFVLASLFRGN